MSLKDDEQRIIQIELDFSSALTGEAREAGREETESSGATSGPESPARTNRLMEEVCERENLKAALKQVKANQGSPGVDGMTVVGIKDYLKQHWPAIRETTAEWNLQTKSGEASRNPQTRWRGAQARHPNSAGSNDSAGGDAGSTEAVGRDIFRT